MNLKILTSLGELHYEMNNLSEAINCYINAVMRNPLALFTLKKILNYASTSIVEDFVQRLSKKVTDEFLPLTSGPLNILIQAHSLARLPTNFRKVCQIYFDLRTCKTSKQQTNVKDNSVTIYLPQKISTDSGVLSIYWFFKVWYNLITKLFLL